MRARHVAYLELVQVIVELLEPFFEGNEAR